MPILLGPIAPVLAGVLAALLLFGAYLLFDVIINALDSLIGSRFFTRFAQGAHAVIAQTVDYLFGPLSAAAAWAGDFIQALPRALGALIDSIEGALLGLRFALAYVKDFVVPALWRGIASSFNQAVSIALAAVASTARVLSAAIAATLRSAVAYTDRLAGFVYQAIRDAVAGLQGLVARVAAQLTASIGAAVRALQALIAKATTLLYAAIASAVQSLRAFATQLAQWAVTTAFNAAVSVMTKYVLQALAELEKVLFAACARALAPAWPTVVDAVEGIARALPGSLAGSLPRLGVIPRAMPTTFAGALSAVVAIGAIALDWVRLCGLPLCRRLGRLGFELENLQDELLILEVLDMVETAVSDPRGAADEAASILTTLIDEVGSGLRGSIGL